MPSETELIKQQMGQTRATLSEKLETLETKVLGSVASTTDTVAQTVQEVGATVRETAQDVRAALHETLSSVREAFSVSRQFQQHPWLMLGGSVLAGYIGNLLLDSLEQGSLPSLPSLPQAEQLLPRASEVRQRMEAEIPTRRRTPAFLQALTDTFAPELEKLKAAAVGMALSVLRDKISESVPPHMRTDFTEMMDRITTKLGGQPCPSASVCRPGEDHEESNGAHTQRGTFRG
jgi:hypothetical protein